MAKIVLDGTSINFTYSDTNKATKEKKVTIGDNTISFEDNIITLVTKTNYDNKPSTTSMSAIAGISNDNGNKLFLKDDNIINKITEVSLPYPINFLSLKRR